MLKIKNPSTRMLFICSLLWALVLLLLGGWWLYLIFNFENLLSRSDHHKITKMITWEGGSFIVLLILISSTLLFLYLKDQKKTKDLQVFFASLTHELKTPLASIKLQSEVIEESLNSNSDPLVHKLLRRLVQDTNKLETQMDKILQLSRIERGGELNLNSIEIVSFIKNLSHKADQSITINIHHSENSMYVIGDEFALELIIKNLFENTKNHTTSNSVDLDIKYENDKVVLLYKDSGIFNGDASKLGELFYKHNSKKGSGIGIYLIKKLLSKMKAQLIIESKGSLVFKITFQVSRDEYA